VVIDIEPIRERFSAVAPFLTKTGLTVRCELDTGQYPSGVVVSNADMAAINLKRAEFHGE